MLWYALVLISVVLSIGSGTFVRSVAINCADDRWVTGSDLLYEAYLGLVPELDRVLVTSRERDPARVRLGDSTQQRLADMTKSQTTTSTTRAMIATFEQGALPALAAKRLNRNKYASAGARPNRCGVATSERNRK